jgi:tRNA uridine 5-carboxymethylaminomethyl modification enzyme
MAEYGEEIKGSYSLADLIKRPNLGYDAIARLDSVAAGAEVGCALRTETMNGARCTPYFPREIREQVEVEIKYSGYIDRQNAQIEQADRLEKVKIPEDIDYQAIKQLSQESRDRLTKVRPVNLAQASRVGGVTPADISILLVILESRRRVPTMS